MENSEFVRLYNEFKAEQNGDFHFQILAEMIDIGGINGNKFTLKARTEFSRENFKERYLLSLQKKLLEQTENALLEIILDKPTKRVVSPITHPNKRESKQEPSFQEFQFGGLIRSADNVDSKSNFENYIEGDNNRWAIAIGKALSRERNPSYNPFFIWGNVGLGKTHLLHAIGNTCKKYHQRVLYTSTENFFNNFLNAIRTNRQDYFKRKYRNVDILLIDDIHDLQKKSKAQDELFYIFNQFQEEGKQLVFTCDRPPQELKEFTERLASRLKSGTNVCIEVPSYEVRLAIIKNKALEAGLQLPDKILKFLGEHISESVRDLAGAIKKIQILSELLQQNITVELLQKELQEFFGQRQRPLMVRTIQGHIASYYNLNLADILSKRRNANIALARQVAMYLSRELTALSTTELGKTFSRDHATIISGVRKIKKMQHNDQKFASELDSLKRELQTAC